MWSKTKLDGVTVEWCDSLPCLLQLSFTEFGLVFCGDVSRKISLIKLYNNKIHIFGMNVVLYVTLIFDQHLNRTTSKAVMIAQQVNCWTCSCYIAGSSPSQTMQELFLWYLWCSLMLPLQQHLLGWLCDSRSPAFARFLLCILSYAILFIYTDLIM